MRVRDLVIGGSLIGAAIAVGRWSSTPEGRGVDAELFGELNRGHGPGADAFFAGVTELGSLWASAGAAAALALVGRRRAAANALAAAGVIWLVGQGVKRAVNRPRPYMADDEGTRLMIRRPPASSWPSSHPMVLSTFTTVAGRELGLGPIARSGLTGLGLSVAASRVYVGVHYPSDVTSGFLLGRAVARLWPGRSGARG
jgi:membrane-associated phospholipid phosphatase